MHCCVHNTRVGVYFNQIAHGRAWQSFIKPSYRDHRCAVIVFRTQTFSVDLRTVRKPHYAPRIVRKCTSWKMCMCDVLGQTPSATKKKGTGHVGDVDAQIMLCSTALLQFPVEIMIISAKKVPRLRSKSEPVRIHTGTWCRKKLLSTYAAITVGFTLTEGLLHYSAFLLLPRVCVCACVRVCGV